MHGVAVGPGFIRVPVDQREGAAVARAVVTNDEPPGASSLNSLLADGWAPLFSSA